MEDAGNRKWQELLAQFQGAIYNSPPPKEIKESLLALKKEAIASGVLTDRQVEGIVARCDNYLNGTYGRQPFNPQSNGKS